MHHTRLDPSTLPALNRADARRHRRRRRQTLTAAVTGVAGAALLVTVASLVHPVSAQARGGEVVTTNASTATVGTQIYTTPDVGPTVDLSAKAKETADARASLAVDRGTSVLASVTGKVDTAPLVASINALSSYQYLDATTVNTLATTALATTAAAQSGAQAADQAAAQAAADAAAAAEALALANTPDGAKETARELAASTYGWGDSQFQCLVNLWQKESGWNYQAENASSGAAGIPQSLPGSKMASFGDDWQTNASTQIAWGLDYISRGYGTPCAAWSHSQSVNWY
ncbi:hypothetical protein GCM10010988_00500 [Cnuibacter physcomitrellae]|uniref:aggregation-promoting factor C-terminal-like domain-containing protein n=1 Tax=Cnuibacter physcomitrellae TaxID=1619308 RepID=UPI0019C4A0E3|nr:hypothetical protein [Cnuibacter physcomitrellae]GGI34753.1 hypothetical protein GCM10010988_00500 [Cnuibacter physcomitrellae]